MITLLSQRRTPDTQQTCGGRSRRPASHDRRYGHCRSLAKMDARLTRSIGVIPTNGAYWQVFGVKRQARVPCHLSYRRAPPGRCSEAGDFALSRGVKARSEISALSDAPSPPASFCLPQGAGGDFDLVARTRFRRLTPRQIDATAVWRPFCSYSRTQSSSAARRRWRSCPLQHPHRRAVPHHLRRECPRGCRLSGKRLHQKPLLSARQ